MKSEDQNIAIAEACRIDVKVCPIHRSRVCCGRGYPDYLSNLNAMHEAERLVILHHDFNNARRNLYAENLRVIIGPHGNMRKFDYAHASAAQRAEAFLKTVGRWTE